MHKNHLLEHNEIIRQWPIPGVALNAFAFQTGNVQRRDCCNKFKQLESSARLMSLGIFEKKINLEPNIKIGTEGDSLPRTCFLKGTEISFSLQCAGLVLRWSLQAQSSWDLWLLKRKTKSQRPATAAWIYWEEFLLISRISQIDILLGHYSFFLFGCM